MSKEKRNNSENESEIESKVVTVGSNQGHRALMVVILVLLAGGIYYYFYFSPSSDEGDVEVLKKEETKQNIHELKEGLEQVPDNTTVRERIITDLPSLPPLSIPQTVPEVKQINKEKVAKKEEEKTKETPISNIPVLPKQTFFIAILTAIYQPRFLQ